MIISAPTGLYKTILPGKNDAGNITWTISMQNPPRSNTSLIQLPLSEILKESPLPYFNKQESRQFLGELVFDISTTGVSESGSGVDAYEIGDIIDFSVEDELKADNYELDNIEMRQDTKSVDYEKFGITNDEYKSLVDASYARVDFLTSKITSVSLLIINNSDDIKSNQANINDANKLYNNIVAILGKDSPLAIRMANSILIFESIKNNLLNDRNNFQLELDNLRTELNKVREVVR